MSNSQGKAETLYLFGEIFEVALAGWIKNRDMNKNSVAAFCAGKKTKEFYPMAFEPVRSS
jgi:hypothetical protein